MLSETLERARGLVAGGWHRTVSVDARGQICTPDDEGVTRFSILDAVDVASRGDETLLRRGMRALGRLVEPERLGDWEAVRGRTQAEVLQLFTRATKHALTKEQS